MSDQDRIKLVDDLISQDREATVKDFIEAVIEIDEECRLISLTPTWQIPTSERIMKQYRV